MLCKHCWLMLRGQHGRQWKGSFQLSYNHHDSLERLESSVSSGCTICHAIKEELQTNTSAQVSFGDKKLETTASLSEITNIDAQKLWRLDFHILYQRLKYQRTFLLKRVSRNNPNFRTPKSCDTSSDEVFHLVMQWITQCQCVTAAPDWYPSRLIDITNIRRDYDIHEPGITRRANILRVVDTMHWKNGPGHRSNRYVTLSHCWGTAQHHGLILKHGTEETLKAGFAIKDLKKTFQDAVHFASRLPRVGYIWIDSLCIKQGDEKDWLIESAFMDEVYKNAYLNISATAASDGDQGLFFKRSPEVLFEDEVLLNTEGVPPARRQYKKDDLVLKTHPIVSRFHRLGAIAAIGYFQELLGRLRITHFIMTLVSAVWKRIAPETKGCNTAHVASVRSLSGLPRADPANLQRCILLDASFWSSRVDKAPVNTRAWVLQERLLCPRVVHFCRDQVAWECSEFDAAESRPPGMPNLQLTREGVIYESRFKSMDPHVDCKKLRQARLRGQIDPVQHLQPEIYAFELWKRVVEMYSQTRLTDDGDKLIAISGIARIIAHRIGTETEPAQYVAGLWRKHLESQLLWKVEQFFQPEIGAFEHSGRRPAVQRAPSFSWAAVNIDAGIGVTYGEISDKDIYIQVDSGPNAVQIDMRSAHSDAFGPVTGGRIVLWGKLRKATLLAKEKGRFYWHLRGHGELDHERHTNVYLDAVSDLGGRSCLDDIYCVPAAMGGTLGTGDMTYIFCLLLRLKNQEKAIYERIGLVKLGSRLGGSTHDQILDVEQSDDSLPHIGFKDGRHRFVLE